MKKIDNKFIDLIMLILSVILTIFRSILVLIGYKKDIKKNYSLDTINFFGQIWPKYYWKKPTGYKIGSFIGDFLNYTFYNKDTKNEK